MTIDISGRKLTPEEKKALDNKVRRSLEASEIGDHFTRLIEAQKSSFLAAAKSSSRYSLIAAFERAREMQGSLVRRSLEASERAREIFASQVITQLMQDNDVSCHFKSFRSEIGIGFAAAIAKGTPKFDIAQQLAQYQASLPSPPPPSLTSTASLTPIQLERERKSEMMAEDLSELKAELKAVRQHIEAQIEARWTKEQEKYEHEIVKLRAENEKKDRENELLKNESKTQVIISQKETGQRITDEELVEILVRFLLERKHEGRITQEELENFSDISQSTWSRTYDKNQKFRDLLIERVEKRFFPNYAEIRQIVIDQSSKRIRKEVNKSREVSYERKAGVLANSSDADGDIDLNIDRRRILASKSPKLVKDAILDLIEEPEKKNAVKDKLEGKSLEELKNFYDSATGDGG